VRARARCSKTPWPSGTALSSRSNPRRACMHARKHTHARTHVSTRTHARPNSCVRAQRTAVACAAARVCTRIGRAAGGEVVCRGNSGGPNHALATSAPGLTRHICVGTDSPHLLRSHICAGTPTSAPGLTHICAGTDSHLRLN
jgi:hypothetical protein